MIPIVIAIICLLSIIPLATAETIESTSQSININEINSTYQIKEHITINSETLTNQSRYQFQLPTTATDYDITIIRDNTQISNPINNNEIYEIDLNGSHINDTVVIIDITYYLPQSSLYYEKTFLHNTSDLRLTFENTKIYENSMQQKESTIQIKLVNPIQPDAFSLYTIFLIVLLIIIIIVTSYYAFIKRKNGKDRKRHFESTELLETEKTLLLAMLKEIEKMHRTQKLSDDSYHKLKTYYKQQTVEIMSTLER